LRSNQELWQCDLGATIWSFQTQPQGKYFCTSFWESPDVQLRDAGTGELVRKLKHPSNVSSTCWGPDGKTFIVGLETGWLYAWEVESDARPTTWKGHESVVVALGFEPSRGYLASASWDYSIHLWNCPDYRPAVAARGYDSNFQCDFSPEGQWLAAGIRNEIVGLFQISFSSVLRHIYVLPLEERGVWCLDISPDGKLMAAGCTEGLRLLDFATGKEWAFRPFRDCRSAIFTPDGSALVTCGSSGLARWPIERPTDANEVRLGPRESIRDGIPFLFGSLRGDGRWAAAANQKGACVAVYEMNNPTNRFALTEHRGIEQAEFSPDGRWIASATWNGHGVRIWEVASRRLVTELPVDRSRICFSPDSRLLVTSGRSHRVWETGSWRELYHTSEFGVPSMDAFSPDNRLLAVVSARHHVQLLDAATGKELTELEGPVSTPLP
jgi:WD40 repeat protein